MEEGGMMADPKLGPAEHMHTRGRNTIGIDDR